MEDQAEIDFCTGIDALDELLMGVLPGDNILFQIYSIDDYIPFVISLYDKIVHTLQKKLIYFRFAHQKRLITEEQIVNSKGKAKIHEINPEIGFEQFMSQMIGIVEINGPDCYYIFDPITDLVVDWFSDVMVANFFMIICPYLYKIKAVAYFGLKRRESQSHSIKNIYNTTQIVLDIYRNEDSLYIYPIKVYGRHCPTMHMLHKWDLSKGSSGVFYPVHESGIIAKILSNTQLSELSFLTRRLDVWFLTFQKAHDILEKIHSGQNLKTQAEIYKNLILRMMISLDERLFILAVQYFSLEDLMQVGRRMIGTGKIGGKSTGILLAQAILKKNNIFWEKKLEKQDMFFIGSHIFYTFLVMNDCWWARRKLTNPNTFLEGVEETQKKIHSGTFQQYIRRQFSEMLNYFGGSPIIVRSSSLLEDAYGNSFSGKYDSIFLPNQGTPEDRLEKLLLAVKKIYASSISRRALNYRKNRGLLEKDEEMGLLIMRVSGARYGNNYLPQVSGVGFSFNPYVWDEKIQPKSGFIRIVLGLGTRAVNRTEDDFTRLVALNVPNLRPEMNFGEIRKYSQKKVDLLDLENNQFSTVNFRNLNFDNMDFPIELFTETDFEMERRMEELNRKVYFSKVLTFKKLLNDTNFTKDIRNLMNILQKAYSYPVDIEFTLNFFEDHLYLINLLQCRPFQIKKEIKDIIAPDGVKPESTIIKISGPIIGDSIATSIDRIIYIVPSVYGKLNNRDRYSIARLIGKINQLNEDLSKKVMLLAPGRVCTSSPSLGIPTSFAEINNVKIIGEIAEMHSGLVPDVSLGTHFFNNLVEREIAYFALHPDKDGNFLDRDFFKNHPNNLNFLIPGAEKWETAVKIIEVNKNDNKSSININMNAFTQKGICYLKKNNS